MGDGEETEGSGAAAAEAAPAPDAPESVGAEADVSPATDVANTTADQAVATDPAAAEDPPPGAGEEPPPWLTALFSDNPEEIHPRMRAMAAMAADQGLDARGFRGVSLDDIDDPNALRLIHNLRRVVDRVCSKVSDERLELKQQAVALQQMRAAVDEDKSNFLGMFNDERVRKMLELPELEHPLDPLSPEGISRAISEEGAAWFKDVFGKLGEVSEEMQQKAAEAENVRLQQKRQEELRQFVAEHEDFMPHYEAIKAQVDASRGADGIPMLRAEDAYLLVLAKAGALPQQQAPKSTQVAAARAQSRRALGRNSAGPSPHQEPPSGGQPEQILEWMRSNPEAAQAYAARLARRGNGY